MKTPTIKPTLAGLSALGLVASAFTGSTIFAPSSDTGAAQLDAVETDSISFEFRFTLVPV